MRLIPCGVFLFSFHLESIASQLLRLSHLDFCTKTCIFFIVVCCELAFSRIHMLGAPRYEGLCGVLCCRCSLWQKTNLDLIVVLPPSALVLL